MDYYDRLENAAKEQVRATKNFSGVIEVREESDVIYAGAFGFADVANKRRNDMYTRFGIASGAKLLTAIAICKLVEQKKLSFDTLLKEFVDYDNFEPGVTIHHLLTHTSGLPDYFDEDTMEDFSELWVEHPMYLMKEPKDFLSLMAKLKTMFHPGEEFHYNNGAFVILAYIVEQVSKQSFTDFVKENILDVAGMNLSGYFSMDMLPANCAYGYIENTDGTLKTNIYSIPIIGGGDGGVFVTADDISHLWDSLLKYKILGKEMTETLLKPQVHADGDVYYGYGLWMVKKDNEVYKYFITGSDPGVSFRSCWYPESKMLVTVIGNREFATSKIMNEIEKEIG